MGGSHRQKKNISVLRKEGGIKTEKKKNLHLWEKEKMKKTRPTIATEKKGYIFEENYGRKPMPRKCRS